jgi:ssDNA-binding Zn-finger/Zn-ribbon topoisomerase 1
MSGTNVDEALPEYEEEPKPCPNCEALIHANALYVGRGGLQAPIDGSHFGSPLEPGTLGFWCSQCPECDAAWQDVPDLTAEEKQEISSAVSAMGSEVDGLLDIIYRLTGRM